MAVVGVSLLLGSCSAERGPTAEADPHPGSELMAQQVPQGFERPSPGAVGLRPPGVDEPPGRYPFYWTRAVYTGNRGGWGGRGGRGAWATDYPKGDRQFLMMAYMKI